ncbi:unnamed protein product, partial [Coccothraustes coccothraustes]
PDAGYRRSPAAAAPPSRAGFFNASSGSCESFVFGGCGGNGNNFGSERECRESCGATPGTELCSAPPVTGPCRAAFPRWFYVPAEKSCREFTYGGCRGNANNHRDERECLRRCRPQGLFLGSLLALVAALAAGLSLARSRCRARPGAPGAAGGEDRECLMKEPYPA